MPFTTLPTKTPGDVIEASYLNLNKSNTDDHEDRIDDLETAIGAGEVTGPVSSTDNEIARFNGTGGTAIQGSGITIADGASGTLAGSNSGDVTVAGTPNYLTLAAQVLTRALINLASHVTGRLPFANFVAATAATRLVGRGSTSGAGDFEEIALGANLSLVGNTLSATGGSVGALDDLTDVIITTPTTDDILQYDGAEWVNQPIIGVVLDPGTVTDNAIVRWNGTSGSVVQNSTPTVEDDGRIANVTDPSGAQDAATKAYVDGIAINLGKRARVRAATTAAITIATALNNADTLDGVTLATGDLVLVKNQAASEENGVYVVGVSPARFAEFDTYDEHPGSLIAVQEGTVNADTAWLCTSNVGGTINVTALVFSALAAGAPTTASYVTLGTDATLSSERVLTAGTGITLTDAGAGSTLTIATTTTAGAGGSDPITAMYPLFSPSGDDDEFNDSSFSGWTAVNSGANNPTITETNNRASFLLPGGDAAAELHAYMKSGHNSTNDWIEVAFQHAGPTQSYNLFGLIFADGTSYGAGGQVAFGVSPSLTQLPYYSYTNYNSASVISSPGSDVGYPQGVCFLRFKYLGSNSWQGYVSPDGISWAAVGTSQARTLTPTHAGFWMTTWGGNGQHVWSVLYVKFGNG
jgi:hypothetical protein